MLARVADLFRYRTVRFLFSGGIGFATTMSLLYVFTDFLGLWYLFSFVISFFIATAVSFTLQKLFTFNDSTFGARRVSGQAALFFSLASFNLSANSVLLYMLVEYAGQHYLVAQFLVSLLIAIWNFLFYRYIFRAVDESGEIPLSPGKSWKERFPRELLLPLGACLLAMMLAFSISGLYNDRIDTAQYVGEIESLQAFMESGEPIVGRALFKPLPGFVGAILSYVVHPYTALLLINIVLVVGFSIAFYGFLRELAFNRLHSAIGASWAVLAYPVMKYGLGLGTDAWGWLAATLVAFLTLRAVRTEKRSLVLVASFIGFLGSLSKETAALGLLFAGLYLLAMVRPWGVWKTFTWLLVLSVPFFALQAALLGLVLSSGGPTFLDWYAQNDAQYTASYHTLAYLVGVMISTFSALLAFALVGLFAAWKSGEIFKYEWLRVYAPLVLAMSPVLLWPIFISRIVYIQALWVLPLALYGARYLATRITSPVLSYGLFLLPPSAAIVLYLMSGDGSLFEAVRRWI